MGCALEGQPAVSLPVVLLPLLANCHVCGVRLDCPQHPQRLEDGKTTVYYCAADCPTCNKDPAA